MSARGASHDAGPGRIEGGGPVGADDVQDPRAGCQGCTGDAIRADEVSDEATRGCIEGLRS